MKWFRVMGVVVTGMALLAACEQGETPPASEKPSQTDFRFTRPEPKLPGQPGLSGTVAEEKKPDTADINVSASTASAASKDCFKKLNAGEKFETLPAECQKAISDTVSGATAAMQATLSSAASAISSATSSLKPPSFSFGSFGLGSYAESVKKLPTGCHQDGDVGLALPDANFRAAVSKVVNKDSASTQITAADALKLTWLQIPASKGFELFMKLEGLKCFPNLELLDISGHPVLSLEPLATLSKLKVLIIPKTEISSLAPIAKLPIVSLYIDNNPALTDLSPLLSMESLKGGVISALDNPQLKKCQMDALAKLFKVETYDAYCPNADPKSANCGPCGDYGYDCNTKIGTNIYTQVNYNKSKPCEAVSGNFDIEVDPNAGCMFNKISLSINVTDAGSGSTVRIEFQDKNGKTLAKSDAYNLNGKDGNRTFDLGMSNSALCTTINKELARVVFYFTDSGFVDMDYDVQYLYLMYNKDLKAWLKGGFTGYVNGNSSSVPLTYPAKFEGPATEIIQPKI